MEFWPTCGLCKTHSKYHNSQMGANILGISIAFRCYTPKAHFLYIYLFMYVDVGCTDAYANICCSTMTLSWDVERMKWELLTFKKVVFQLVYSIMIRYQTLVICVSHKQQYENWHGRLALSMSVKFNIFIVQLQHSQHWFNSGVNNRPFALHKWWQRKYMCDMLEMAAFIIIAFTYFSLTLSLLLSSISHTHTRYTQTHTYKH